MESPSSAHEPSASSTADIEGSVPKIAVVIVNFRGVELTLAAVASVLASRGVTLDVIVVDNASPDDSAGRLREALPPSVHFIQSMVNGGFTGGNNIGMAAAVARGADWVFLLNNDAVCDPDCIARLVRDAMRDDAIALANPKMFFGDPAHLLWFGGSRFNLWTGRPVAVGRKRPASHSLPEATDIPFVTGAALLVRAAHLPRLGPLDETLFGYSEDLEWSLRATEAGLRLRYVPDAVIWHYEGVAHRRAGGQALRQYLSARNLLRVMSRHLRWYHWPSFLATFAVDHVGRFCLLSLLHRDLAAFRATLRGVLHAITGGRCSIEVTAEGQRAAAPAMVREVIENASVAGPTAARESWVGAPTLGTGSRGERY